MMAHEDRHGSLREAPPRAAPRPPATTRRGRLRDRPRETGSTIGAVFERDTVWERGVAGVSFILVVVALVELTESIPELQPFDERLTAEIAQRRSDIFTDVIQGITTLADTTTLIPLAVIAMAVALRRGGVPLAAPVLGAILTTAIVVAMMKDLIGRERPLPPIRLGNSTSASYPSGHSAHAVASWGAVIWMMFTGRSSARRALGAVIAATIAVCVGFSRVYLGVHWASDVVAGWAVGGICLTVMVVASSRARARERAGSGVESEANPTCPSTPSTKHGAPR